MFQLIGEIDKNPATLLALRGIGMSGLLGLSKSSTVDSVDYPLPTAKPEAAVLESANLSRSKRVAAKSEDRVPGKFVNTARQISLPKFESSAKLISQCLSGPPPLFCPSLDFAKVMSLFYAWLSDKNIAASIGLEHPWEQELDVEKLRPVVERASYTLVVPETYSIKAASVHVDSAMWDASGSTRSKIANRPSIRTPRDVLGSIPFEYVDPALTTAPENTVAISVDTFRRILLHFPGNGTVGSESYIFFSHVVRAALLLFSSANFVPDVVPIDKEHTGSSWGVLYRPFSCNESVRLTLERLKSVHPANGICLLLQRRNGAKRLVDVGSTNAVMHALCVSLTSLVVEIDFTTKQKFGKKGIRVVDCFFNNTVYTPISLQERSNGLAAKRWLSVFGLLSIKADILLRVSDSLEVKNLFKMELFLKPLKVNPEANGQEIRLETGKRSVPAVMVDPRAEGWLDPAKYMMLGKDNTIDTLKFVMTLKEYVPELGALLREGHASIDHETFEKFVLEKSGILSALGILYQLPRGIKGLLRPRLITQISLRDEDGISWRMPYLQMTSLMKFQYRVALGDNLVDMEEFASMVESGRRLFRFKEHYVELDAKHVDTILKMRGKTPPQPGSSMEFIREILAQENSMAVHGDIQRLLQDLQNVEETATPDSLIGELRPYQVRGYQWIWNNLTKVGGCILGDDMGLGKTLQTVAVLLKMKDTGVLQQSPALVVCPTSLLSNWKRECQRFAPSLWVRLSDNTCRKQSAAAILGKKRKLHAELPDVVLMSYATVRVSAAELAKGSFSAVVLDEAQNIKNPTSQIAKACKVLGMRARMRLALTGTVVENRLSELHSCFEFVLPRYLGSIKRFVEVFSKPIEKDRDEDALNLLKRVTAPFMLRRVKSDPLIISDLPGKVETKHWIGLSAEQCALYEGVRDEVFKNLEAEGPVGSGIQRSGLILKLLTSLKQICDHPACYGDDSTNTDASRSLKCLAMFDLLDPVISCGEKVLIFSQYVRMCKILQAQISEKFSVCPLVYDGSLTKKKRDQVLSQFENDPTQQVLVLSLKAGGVGLNLT